MKLLRGRREEPGNEASLNADTLIYMYNSMHQLLHRHALGRNILSYTHQKPISFWMGGVWEQTMGVLRQWKYQEEGLGDRLAECCSIFVR